MIDDPNAFNIPKIPDPPADVVRAAGPSRRGLGAFFWIAVVLPFLGYAGSIGLAEAKRWGAPTIRVAIEGYDPRDPFRGQYLNYRLVIENRTTADGYFSESCVGAPKSGLSPVYLHDGSSRPPECQSDLPEQFANEPHRFYVQQDKALPLERALQSGRAAVTLRLVSKNSVLVDQLLVDGKVIGSQ